MSSGRRHRLKRLFGRCLLSCAVLSAVMAAAAPLSAEPNEHRLALVAPFGDADGNARIREVALTRIAEALGVPYSVVDAPRELERFPVAVLAEGPSNAAAGAVWREALYSYVEAGGILLSPAIVGSDFYPLFGITSVSSGKSRYRLSFRGEDPALSYVDHPREKTISLGNGEQHIHDEVIWSHGAELEALARPLARFEDGSVGFSVSYYGRGSAYYLGLSFVETVLLPQSGGDYEAQRSFINGVEPSADVIMLLVKALFEAYTPGAAYLSAIPYGRETALVLTHDVDAQSSFVDSLKFARLEQEFDVTSTFFETTKYFRDAADIGYYSVPRNKEAIRRLARMGFDIGSHSVTHSYELSDAPPGSPGVSQASYGPPAPITINGEVRVSKQILDRDIPGQDTVAYRSGYLAFPRELIRVLDDAGYRYDSTFSANDVLTTFPYYALEERRPGAALSDIIEIPVTFDDALDFLTEERAEEALAAWKRVMRAHANNETITVLLMHPSDTSSKTYKLRTQRSLMHFARELGAWIGNLTEFGDFWRARSRTTIAESTISNGTLRIRLSRPAGELHPWIAIVLADRSISADVEIEGSGGAQLTFESEIRGDKLLLSNLRAVE